MNFVTRLARRFQRKARRRRAGLFTRFFELDRNTRILDLGGGDGAHLHSILLGTPVRRANVFVADIDGHAIAEAHRRFGFTPVLLDERGCLPFPVGFFDIVYCSSVIEHVTVPKDIVWQVRCGREFRRRAFERQRDFAASIARLGRQYFVQTPAGTFPLESNSWLPFAGYLPRRALVPLLRLTNRFWFKSTHPDWHLLGREELAELFPGALIVEERLWGMTKSRMAVKLAPLPGGAHAARSRRESAAGRKPFAGIGQAELA